LFGHSCTLKNIKLTTVIFGDGPYNHKLIALISAIGITLGRSVIFFASYRGRVLIDNSTLKRMAPLQRLLTKYGSLVSFVAAVTPIPPDDIVIIFTRLSSAC
jgi:uncharacterized membrane protein YdjX (TVP38/TMEM64 family)